MKLLLVVSLLSTAGLRAQTPPSAAEREAHWKEDLRFFAGELGRGQKDFAKLYPPAKFDREMESLGSDIPRLADSEIVLRLMGLVASANVAHNSVTTNAMGFFARLPVTLYWYPDGLAFIGASQQYSTAIGARVVRIGNMTPEELLAGVAPYISHENDVWLHEEASGFVTLRAVLQHFGLINPDGVVSFTLQKPGGEPFTQLVGLANPTQVVKIPLTEALHVPVTLSASQPGKYYWSEYLADSQTLYIQYNQCASDPKLPFSDFAHQVLAEADAHPVKRVVVDLRQNGGGDSSVIAPLKSGLASRLKKIGRVYVLIGPMTFSSAILNAEDLRGSVHATLVGEPTGGSPNGYGEVRTFTLPNSKLVVRYTTKYFSLGKSNSLKPDLAAPRNLADDLAGRDTALSAAIAAP
jgi:hypothetical protein